MPWSRYVLGYHGCDASLARRVVVGEAILSPSRNDYDWLGHGLYFWEDSVDRAREWAFENSQRPSSPLNEPAVLGAVIDLGDCLNLVESQYLKLVRSAYDRLEAVARGIGAKLPRNAGFEVGARKLDCAVFEALHQSREEDGYDPFDTVRAFFTEGDALYPTAGIRHLDHVQICVRSPKNIVGYFLPKRD